MWDSAPRVNVTYSSTGYIWVWFIKVFAEGSISLHFGLFFLNAVWLNGRKGLYGSLNTSLDLWPAPEAEAKKPQKMKRLRDNQSLSYPENKHAFCQDIIVPFQPRGNLTASALSSRCVQGISYWRFRVTVRKKASFSSRYVISGAKTFVSERSRNIHLRTEVMKARLKLGDEEASLVPLQQFADLLVFSARLIKYAYMPIDFKQMRQEWYLQVLESLSSSSRNRKVVGGPPPDFLVPAGAITVHIFLPLGTLVRQWHTNTTVHLKICRCSTCRFRTLHVCLVSASGCRSQKQAETDQLICWTRQLEAMHSVMLSTIITLHASRTHFTPHVKMELFYTHVQDQYRLPREFYNAQIRDMGDLSN
ncbi:uncharacterized protein BDR25DRAFT_351681 [Lindgomyces ingoldianus]|uniref:Uncharacterized protein n=1 Tax=Lindgomyces ingoldianus TaxID=673940 RepID=A0ACB6R4H2_9PLEO|nr:uncharacterized protein BDR25DRAFT_351681 [Lindgomyces ingoldianus]KAF2474149.1 hypothetical protein BDR25DRAFT_351681 [Lindgomyces ingoldianus]